MSRIFFWKVDPKKLVPMRPEEIEDSLKWSERAQLDAMPMGASDVATSVFLHGRPRSVQRDAWRGFYASGFITDDRTMRAVRGALWHREGRLQ